MPQSCGDAGWERGPPGSSQVLLPHDAQHPHAAPPFRGTPTPLLTDQAHACAQCSALLPLHVGSGEWGEPSVPDAEWHGPSGS